MKEICKILPYEDLIYLADTANIPYGSKSKEQIEELTCKNIAFLEKKRCKAIVIACHSASTLTQHLFKQKWGSTLFSMIESTLDLIPKEGKVLLLATKATIESGIYQQKQNGLLTQSCPLFVPLIEEELFTHPAAFLIAKHYLSSFDQKIDAAVLACTHYPFIIAAIREAFSHPISIYDPAKKVAQRLKDSLEKNGLINDQRKKPTHQFFNTSIPIKGEEKLLTFSEQLL